MIKKGRRRGILKILKKISRRLLGEKEEIINARPFPNHDELVEMARHEWQVAQSLFNQVIETDLIDHAIFKLNAAERRYIFLLHETKSSKAELVERQLKPDDSSGVK